MTDFLNFFIAVFKSYVFFLLQIKKSTSYLKHFIMFSIQYFSNWFRVGKKLEMLITVTEYKGHNAL